MTKTRAQALRGAMFPRVAMVSAVLLGSPSSRLSGSSSAGVRWARSSSSSRLVAHSRRMRSRKAWPSSPWPAARPSFRAKSAVWPRIWSSKSGEREGRAVEEDGEQNGHGLQAVVVGQRLGVEALEVLARAAHKLRVDVGSRGGGHGMVSSGDTIRVRRGGRGDCSSSACWGGAIWGSAEGLSRGSAEWVRICVGSMR